MDVKNLLGKLQTEEGAAPSAPAHPKPPAVPSTPTIQDNVKPSIPVVKPRPPMGGTRKMSDGIEDGIILDLGEGLSLNIPIQKRMSLSDFIKLAEKVKALEMLSEASEVRTQ